MDRNEIFRPRIRWTVLLPIILFLASSMPSASEAAERVYTLARAPQISAATTSTIWQPFVDYLSRELGVTITLDLYNLRGDFENDLRSGVPDLAFGNPGYLVVAYRMHGYVPLIHSGAKQLVGILVVKASSGIRGLEQLRGQDIAFPTRTAFAASLLLRAQLMETNGFDFKPVYVGSHDDVYRNVAAGRFVAGGGVWRSLNREPEALRKRLVVIFESPGITPHPLFAHPRVPESVRQAVIAATLKLDLSNQGRALLKNLGIPRPIVSDYDRDYRALEPVALRMYSYFLGPGS